MTGTTGPLIFDGHNDVLLKLRGAGGRPALKLFHEGRDGHIDVPRSKRGGFGGGFFAIFVPSPMDREIRTEEMNKPAYDLPLPEPIPQAEALPAVMEMAALLMQLEAEGALRICRKVADIRAAWAEGKLAAILHIEGAEAIDPDFHALDVLYAAGLRSLGPVWSRPTIWGEGVPFRYPSTGDTGAGLTEDGKRLVKRCGEMGVMIDLSHLNEKGFWDVAELSPKPLVATHSNAYALCPHARNLTDAQLDGINAKNNGLITFGGTPVIAQDDTAQTHAGEDVLIDVLANDRDPDGGAVRVDGLGDPRHGDVYLQDDGSVLYSPNEGFSGTDSFTYWSADEEGFFTQATVTVTVDGWDPSM